jgi:CubicO group peptidase (beta-lactamase class C family)
MNAISGRRIWRTAALVLAALVLCGAVWLRPDRAARSAAGLTAHNLCSAVFVAGQEAQATFEDAIVPLVGTAANFIDYRVDPTRQRVEATFARIVSATAHYVPGFGCRLEQSGDQPSPQPVSIAAVSPADPAPMVAPTDPRLATALERVFAERPGEPVKRVKAVIVVKSGQIVAERYAERFGPGTPLISWSVAKSFTNALLGILVRQGRLRVEQPVMVPEWSTPGDLRARLTIEDLLRMQSGLDAPEEGAATDVVTRMLYAQSNMGAFAAQRPLKVPSGTKWEYTSANTLILNRMMASAVGGGANGMRAFAERELFAPLDMRGVTMEFDGAGTFIGSSYVFATARTFAQFGQLYLDDGVVVGGKRLLPEGWVSWSRRSTLGVGYGAGFWTNDGPGTLAARRVASGFPKDGFFASGNLGQRIYIVPSARLVIARFGDSAPPDFGIDDDLYLIKTAIAMKSARELDSRSRLGATKTPPTRFTSAPCSGAPVCATFRKARKE